MLIINGAFKNNIRQNSLYLEIFSTPLLYFVIFGDFGAPKICKCGSVYRMSFVYINYQFIFIRRIVNPKCLYHLSPEQAIERNNNKICSLQLIFSQDFENF